MRVLHGMENRHLRFVGVWILLQLICLCLWSPLQVKAAQMDGDEVEVVEANSYIECLQSPTSSAYTNLVLFVDFSDTVVHNHSTYSANSCFKANGNADITYEMFNGTDHEGNVNNKRGLVPYIYNVSYGMFSVKNIFPQYDSTTNTMVPYVLDGTAAYYKENPTTMVDELMQKLDNDIAAKNLIGDSVLSHETSGVLDNLIIVTGCAGSSLDDPFGGITYHLGGGSFTANTGITYTVGSFNIIPESGAYLGVSGSGVIIHEFMHSIGYPDLYCNADTTGYRPIPVGIWDIMSSVSANVQYPLAYMRQYISGWLNLDTVTTNKTGYQLVAASSTDSTNKNQQAVILRTPYSDSEFFVVEYRKKEPQYTDRGGYSYNYDTKIPGSGLIIYRIDTKQHTNISGAPYMVYIYRKDDSIGASGYEAGNASDIYLDGSCLSFESGITSYGCADASKGLEDGAITYSDGTNSGIVISNVGSASSNTISFDISFHNVNQDTYWTVVTDGRTAEKTKLLSSCMASNGDMYYVQTAYSDAGGETKLYKERDGIWTEISSAPESYNTLLTNYNNELYMAYIDSSGYLMLVRYGNNSWATVYKSDIKVTEFDMSSNTGGIDLVFNGTMYSGVYNYHYSNGSGDLSMIESPSSTWYAGSCVTSVNGDTYVVYRDFNHGNALIIKTLKNNAWASVNAVYNSDLFFVRGDGTNLYLVLQETEGLNVYKKNTENPSMEWSRIGGCITAETPVSWDMLFDKGVPYIALSYTNYSEVVTLQDDSWKRVGNKIALSNVNNLKMYMYNNDLYVTYKDNTTNHTVLKKYPIADNDDTQTTENTTEQPEDIPTPIIVESEPMYRLYNPNSGEHFYTASVGERDYLVFVGWNYEGIAWYAPKFGNPVYRLYNPNAGDHHYTLSAFERDYLVKVGWNYEGISWYSGGTVPLYRAYNPNARAGSHHYTISRDEIDYIVKVGWKNEGIGWYGIK